jgi:hypothetical protein
VEIDPPPLIWAVLAPAMSGAIVELVELLFEAFEKHDESAMLELVHPESESTSLDRGGRGRL